MTDDGSICVCVCFLLDLSFAPSLSLPVFSDNKTRCKRFAIAKYNYLRLLMFENTLAQQDLNIYSCKF